MVDLDSLSVQSWCVAVSCLLIRDGAALARGARIMCTPYAYAFLNTMHMPFFKHFAYAALCFSIRVLHDKKNGSTQHKSFSSHQNKQNYILSHSPSKSYATFKAKAVQPDAFYDQNLGARPKHIMIFVLGAAWAIWPSKWPQIKNSSTWKLFASSKQQDLLLRSSPSKVICCFCDHLHPR